MTRTTATHRLSCIGDTRPAKESLKARGWKWDPEARNWYMMLVDAHAQQIVDGDVEFFRGLGGHKKGCQLILDGIIRWTSSTYSPPANTQTSSRTPDQDGYGWNADAHGNLAGKRIAGSAPDDMI